MVIPENIFKSYDIRGTYPDQLNETNVTVIARSIYTFFQNKLEKLDKIKILISRDMRMSSDPISEAVIGTLYNLGAEVVDAGIISTPTFYYAVSNLGFEAGIQITASHNPKDYNGLKFVLVTPKGLLKIGKSTGMDEIKKVSLEEKDLPVKTDYPKDEIKRLENLVEKEVKNAFTLAVDNEIKSFKIVADPAKINGGKHILEVILKKIMEI